MKDCVSLTVQGPFHFRPDNVFRGRVRLENTSRLPCELPPASMPIARGWRDEGHLPLRFHTHYGQSLWLAWANESRKQTPTTTTKAAETGETAPRREPPTLDREKEGSGKLLPLTYLNSDFWQVTVELADDAFSEQTFLMNTCCARRTARKPGIGDGPFNQPPRLKAAELLIIDSWNFRAITPTPSIPRRSRKSCCARPAAGERRSPESGCR